jgi:hypothetical protein
MAEQKEEEKRRFGVPKYYYWGKKPPKPKKAQTRFANLEQKKFYLVQLAFRTAKVTAIVVAFLMIFSKI